MKKQIPEILDRIADTVLIPSARTPRRTTSMHAPGAVRVASSVPDKAGRPSPTGDQFF